MMKANNLVKFIEFTSALAELVKPDSVIVGFQRPHEYRLKAPSGQTEHIRRKPEIWCYYIPKSKGTNKHKIKTILQPEFLRGAFRN
ncbi:Transient Receptor Potential Cation Channel Subfamily M Member 7 [Manis pentadactyla]|nr:Transient Receptor Potential Cation Channel Subfamily M Member 7 [Manis pentadactyla]